MVALTLAFVEVEGVWMGENVWSSTATLSCCCRFVLSFGWDSMWDDEPTCGCVCPEALDCTGVQMASLSVEEELALASLEVEGAEPGSPVRTPDVTLL